MKSMCHEVRRNSPSVAARSPMPFLRGHDVPDRRVLGGPQAGVVEPAGGVLGAGLQQGGRAQQAADVVGPERRFGARGHAGGT